MRCARSTTVGEADARRRGPTPGKADARRRGPTRLWDSRPRRCERITFLLGECAPRLFDGDPSPPTRPTHLGTSAARAMPVWPCSPRGRCLHGARTWPDPAANTPRRLALCPRAGASIVWGAAEPEQCPTKPLAPGHAGQNPLRLVWLPPTTPGAAKTPTRPRPGPQGALCCLSIIAANSIGL